MRPVGVIAAVIVLLGLAFQGAEAAPTTYDVAIPGRYYSPPSITVMSGDTVVWTNYTSETHTVTSDSNVWNSGPIPPGGTFTRTFVETNQDVLYRYHCAVHNLSMTGGEVRVVHSATPSPTPSSTSGATPTPTPTPPGGSGSPGPTATPTPTPTGGGGPTPTPTPTGGTSSPTPIPPGCAPPVGDAIAIGPLYVWYDGLFQETNSVTGLQRADYRCGNGTFILADRRIL